MIIKSKSLKETYGKRMKHSWIHLMGPILGDIVLMDELRKQMRKNTPSGKLICPRKEDVFNAFN